MLVEDDISLVVLHDVVAVQTVALVVEIVLAFGAGEFFGGDDRSISLPPNVLAEICDLPLPIQLKGGSLTATRFTRWVERNNHSKADAEE